jgi:hypothetical protein
VDSGAGVEEVTSYNARCNSSRNSSLVKLIGFAFMLLAAAALVQSSST